MSIMEFLSELRQLGVALWVENGSLKYQAPKGAVTKELLGSISQRKKEIISFLSKLDMDIKNSREKIDYIERTGQDFPLSFSQQSLWFVDQMSEDNATYNIPNALSIKGELDLSALEKSINEIVKRHEALRTTFINKSGKPFQKINDHQDFKLRLITLDGKSIEEKSQKLKEMLASEAWQPFDLANGPIWRILLIKIDKNEHILSFTVHHIISDAWSNGIFVNDFLSYYGGFVDNSKRDLPELPIQFADYAVWQREFLCKKDILEPLTDFWKKQLSGYSTLELPSDKVRPATQSFDGASYKLLIPHELSERLKRTCIDEDVTLFMLLLAAFDILLFRYSGQEDISIGTVVANRNKQELTGLFGFFMNTLVLRNDLSGNPSVHELLKSIKNTTLDAYTYQELPFDVLLEEIKPERDVSRTPVFQVMYIHQNATEVSFEANGLEIKQFEIDNIFSPFDLRLISEETANGILLKLDYCSALYGEQTISKMVSHFINIIEELCRDRKQSISCIEILSRNEKKALLSEFSKGERTSKPQKFIPELFEDIVVKYFDKTAVVFESKSITYNELNQRANQLAHMLKENYEVGPNIAVGVCMERSFEMVISLLAILKAGGAYIPFDPDYPADRVDYMIGNAQVKVMLTMQRHLGKVSKCDAKIINLDDISDLLSLKSMEDLPNQIKEDDLAYIIYTSGSTGAPKGAMNTHVGMTNHKLWMQTAYKLSENDSVLQKTPFSFDVSVWEFFWPLINGAVLVMAKPEGHKDPQYLIDTIINEKITIIHFVPSMLYAFLEQQNVRSCSSLRQVFCSGEALNPDLLKRFTGVFGIPIHNVYGPAECADVSTSWTFAGEFNSTLVPIGKPISNVDVYILDKYHNVVPQGVAGEIYIGGMGVGKGYINNPELTQERYLGNCFETEITSLMYKTGDVGRFLPDGNIEYLGRTDFQVKIRGMRIELGEIERCLVEHQDIKSCAVIAWEKDNGNIYLVSYIVSEQGKELDTRDVQRFIAKKLPDYMVPRILIQIDELPLNPNGKLDRKALPAPDLSAISKNSNFEAPRNEFEEAIVGIWREVLGIEEIGINDNFFEIGGHSLLLVEAHNKITQKFQIEFSLIEMFAHSTVSSLSAFLSGNLKTPAFVKNTDRLQKQKDAKLRRKQLRNTTVPM